MIDATIYEVLKGARRADLLQAIALQFPELQIEWDGQVQSAQMIGVNLGSEKIQIQFTASQNQISTAARVRFTIDGGRAYVEGVLQVNGDQGEVHLAGKDFYAEQRRHEFRRVIPANYSAQFEVTSRSQGILPIVLQVQDVNSEGLQVHTDQGDDFEIGETLEGWLSLGKHAPVRLAGEVRFLQRTGKNAQLGLKLNHAVFESESPMVDTLGFLHHDLFQLKNSSIKK